MLNEAIGLTPALAGLTAFTFKRLLRYLRYHQQEEYDTKRFLQWVLHKKAFDKVGSLLALSASLFSVISLNLTAIFSLGYLLAAYMEENPCREGKLKLVLTPRAKRILLLATFFYAISAIVIDSQGLKAPFWWLFQIALIQATPLYLALAGYFQHFHEKYLQRQFLLEAKAKLKAYDPYVIGITGSYGKTSTKHNLAHILQVTLGPTFWPVKGTNTLMGNTREIRLNLQPGHRFAVMEMGAYYQGSIARLCDLSPPKAAIITGVGLAHLERYKSQSAIESAKSELAQALPDDGILVCNGDNEGARRIAQTYRKPKQKIFFYGLQSKENELDCRIHSWKVEAEGTRFKIDWKGKTYEGYSSQYGQTCLSNLAAAFTLACALGANPDYVLAVIRHLETVDNRLKVTKEGSLIYFRDAYNSNPEGFQAALEVLAAYPLKRRILMTPGMIEFGSMQSALNIKLGKLAGEVCDLAIIVGRTNQKELVQGLTEGGMDSHAIEICQTRFDAFEKLKFLQQEGDGVLIENDLTDLYELTPRF